MSHDMPPRAFARLAEENDELRETVRQLRNLLRPTVMTPAAWKLTNSEADFLFAVRAGRGYVCHHERLMVALYGMVDDAPQPKILDVYACKLRAKLRRAETGITIETVWGRGWRMDAASCARLDALIAEARPADDEQPVRMPFCGAPSQPGKNVG